MNTMNGYAKFEKLMANFALTFIKPITKQKLENANFVSTQNSIEFIIFNGFTEI